MIAVTSDGKVYRDTGDGTFSANTAISTGLGTLDNSICLMSGGAESAGRNKKLFFFTGTSQVKVLSGDGAALTTLTTPSADWSSSFPKFGILHKNRIFAFGNSNDPHRIYACDPVDHENWTTNSLNFSVFPGEGDKLVGGYVYKGRLFVFKSPAGAYYLEDSDNSSTNWYFKKLSSSFGIASPHAAVQILDDLNIGNNTGSITSMAATQAFGDIASSDILTIMGFVNYMRDNTSAVGFGSMHSIYYSDKKQAMFTYRSKSGSFQDRILLVDVAKQQNPRSTWLTKDQPTCLYLVKDAQRIERPYYGSETGYIYKLDQASRNVNGSSYTGEFQTPHMDFGFADQGLAGKNKLFDFLEVVFEPSGTWSASVDVFIDGILTETIQFQQFKGRGLGGTTGFVLDTDRLDGGVPQSIRKPIHGIGKRISFRVYNSGLDESFIIAELIVSFRISGEQEKAFSS